MNTADRRKLSIGLLVSVFVIAAVGRADAPADEPAASASRSASSPVAIDRDAVSRALDKLVTKVRSKKGKLGVAVVEVSTGSVVAQHGGTALMNPASNMKILTAWGALRALGPGHRYLTALYGRIDGKRVPKLLLRGDGDPSLEMRHLWEMVARLHRAGVREVGDIVVDQSHFDGAYVPPAFGQQPNEWASFRAPVAAVSLARNTVMIEVRPGQAGQAARVVAVPSSFVAIKGRVKTSEAGDPEAVRLTLKPDGSRLSAVLGGSLPADSKTVRLYRRVADPSLLAGYGLRDACQQIGIEVGGEVKLGKGRGELLSAHRSKPLARLLHALGKDSNNFYAEMIFKSLSVARDAPPASFERSADKLSQLFDEAGIERQPMRWKNGSGLFDANRLTALGVTRLLAASYRDPRVGPELVSQLAVGGVDGTLRHRFGSLRRARLLRAKSGTLAAVSALSGYLLGADGKPTLAFAVFINGARGEAVRLRRDIDRFVTAVAREVTP